MSIAPRISTEDSIRLREAGVLARVKNTLVKYRGIYDLPAENVEIIDVVTKSDDRHGERTQMVIALDRGERRVTHAFAVRKGESFGAHGEQPLTPEQYELVMSLAKKKS